MALTNTAKIPAASLKTDCSNTKYAAKPIQLHQNTPALVPFNDYLLSFLRVAVRRSVGGVTRADQAAARLPAAAVRAGRA